ncbi:unnamed protein product [Adineta ricciae]|uniref:Uncharacterized protein n=1 Tax=Adineta ricciae TaxID=249248 RepID=A0A813XJE8_ADIRI|nr:unnamed protein product [Adineta ricciae]
MDLHVNQLLSKTKKKDLRFRGDRRDNVSMDFVQSSCEQTTKELLKLAHTFAQKSRRPPTQLTCTDLVNAFDFMSTRKIVYYMRHFEALHNVRPYDFSIRDPELSAQGQSQAASAIQVLETIPIIDLVVCSPLKRTLQTYLLMFGNRRNLPLIIHPDIQEVCNEPCDTGSSVEDLKKTFPTLTSELDVFEQTFGGVEWLEKTKVTSIYSLHQVEQRRKRFLQWLMNRPERHIFVISHNLMLQELICGDRNEKIDIKNGEIKTVEY